MTAGTVTLSTSWWQDSSRVLKSKAKEKVHGSSLLILPEPPVVAVPEPAGHHRLTPGPGRGTGHHRLTAGPGRGDVRPWQLGGAGLLRPSALCRLQRPAVSRQGRLPSPAVPCTNQCFLRVDLVRPPRPSWASPVASHYSMVKTNVLTLAWAV